MIRKATLVWVVGSTVVLGFFWTSHSEEDREISVMGSDTMHGLSSAWKQAYQKVAPTVQVTLKAEGTGTGFVGLNDGTAQMATAIRPIKKLERERLNDRYGTEPMEHVVGHRAFAVFVHPDNPVKSLSMDQLRGIWSEEGGIDNWKQLGGSDLAIERRVRDDDGNIAFYHGLVCGKGREFKLGCILYGDQNAPMVFCEDIPAAIVLAGVGDKNDKVKMLSVSQGDGPAYLPTNEAIARGDYPLARPLLIYTIGKLTVAVQDYLHWIKGASGQAIIVSEGFFPIALPE